MMMMTMTMMMRKSIETDPLLLYALSNLAPKELKRPPAARRRFEVCLFHRQGSAPPQTRKVARAKRFGLDKAQATKTALLGG
jgi:hypothetical protein